MSVVIVTTKTISGRNPSGSPIETTSTMAIRGTFQYDGGGLTYALGGKDRVIDATFICKSSAIMANSGIVTFEGHTYTIVYAHPERDYNGRILFFEAGLRKKE